MSQSKSGHVGLALYWMPGHLIRRLAQVGASVFYEYATTGGFDLTSVQYAALKAIERHPGIGQASLAGAIAYDRTTIGGVVDRLENKGLIRREQKPGDRRARQLFLERAGKQALTKLDPMVEAMQAKILTGLTEQEKIVFVRLLKKAADGANNLSRAPLRPLPPS